MRSDQVIRKWIFSETPYTSQMISIFLKYPVYWTGTYNSFFDFCNSLLIQFIFLITTANNFYYLVKKFFSFFYLFDFTKYFGHPLPIK